MERCGSRSVNDKGLLPEVDQNHCAVSFGVSRFAGLGMPRNRTQHLYTVPQVSGTRE